VEDLRAAGAMAVLLKDALKPNLMQTLEHSPVLVHTGPFGNVAHGNNSILANRMALKLADYVVTESGFGADMGFEKLVDIVCRAGNLQVNAAVVACTIRALKMHGGVGKIVAGKPLPPELLSENLPALDKGLAGLEAAVRIVRRAGVPVVVALNRFATDTENELAFVLNRARQMDVFGAAVSDVHAHGAAGGRDLAELAVAAADRPAQMKFFYPDTLSIREKIEILTRDVYGAASVDFAPEARRKMKLYEEMDFGRLPICMAKTHLSLSHDANMKGVPHGYVFPVRDIRLSAGAGFLYPLAGDMQTMPGLGAEPAAARVDFDTDGNIVGLF
jgi:formate--tetrahydrofolate ligase